MIIIIVYPWDVVFPRAKALEKTTPLGWTIMMFTLSAGNNCIMFYFTAVLFWILKNEGNYILTIYIYNLLLQNCWLIKFIMYIEIEIKFTKKKNICRNDVGIYWVPWSTALYCHWKYMESWMWTTNVAICSSYNTLSYSLSKSTGNVIFLKRVPHYGHQYNCGNPNGLRPKNDHILYKTYVTAVTTACTWVWDVEK